MAEEIKPKISPEMREALNADFPAEAYAAHTSKTYLTTLKAAYVMERLNNVFGVGRWDIDHKIIKDDIGYVLMSGRIVILDYDVVIPVQYGGHTTTGTGTELADGYKSAITDILSKSASYIEIGLDMFKGKIDAPNSGKPTGKGSKNTSPKHDAVKCPDDYLTPEYLDKNWNGKLYGVNVYFNNIKYFVNDEWAEWLKKHPKYKPQK